MVFYYYSWKISSDQVGDQAGTQIGIIIFHGPYCFFGFKYAEHIFIIYLRKRERERSHPLAYSPNACNSWSWAGLKAGAQSRSHVGGRHLATWTIIDASQRVHQEKVGGINPGHSIWDVIILTSIFSAWPNASSLKTPLNSCNIFCSFPVQNNMAISHILSIENMTEDPKSWGKRIPTSNDLFPWMVFTKEKSIWDSFQLLEERLVQASNHMSKKERRKKQTSIHVF